MTSRLQNAPVLHCLSISFCRVLALDAGKGFRLLGMWRERMSMQWCQTKIDKLAGKVQVALWNNCGFFGSSCLQGGECNRKLVALNHGWKWSCVSLGRAFALFALDASGNHSLLPRSTIATYGSVTG
ncbi:hypothetical protein BDV34DRAFT_88862 [Aspergillus parasiticus]|uniref:Uncharacterized protein n=1 Tax=Aspergillus parasiticus TaxID=5067 RepID=A0A5N6E2L5_ASPPA|nr:hypothetical protein BDV34DRAFT_88862 [Aspergillus parasiticus]